MSRARNLADLLDANGDVASGALDNVPASNDASALTTGTLPIARIADGDITAAKLGSTLDLSGKTVTLPAGTGGKVLQVVQGTLAGDLGASSTGSTSYIDTGLTASITPTTSGNKILIFVSYRPKIQAPTANDLLAYVNLVEGSTSIHELRIQADNLGKLGDTVYFSYNIPMNVQRTTSSTSSLTYKIQFACGNGGVGYYKFEDSTMTLMEIAA